MLATGRERGGRNGHFGSTRTGALLPKEGYIMKMEERDKTYKTKLCTRMKKMTQGEFSDRVNKVIVDGERRIKEKQELLNESDKLPFGYVGLRPNWPRQNDGIARIFPSEFEWY